jgi:hypothetical protein
MPVSPSTPRLGHPGSSHGRRAGSRDTRQSQANTGREITSRLRQRSPGQERRQGSCVHSARHCGSEPGRQADPTAPCLRSRGSRDAAGGCQRGRRRHARLRASAFDLTSKPHRSAPVRLRRLTDPGRNPARTDLCGASPYHPRITKPSPTGQTLSDQKAPTCNFMPAVDWHRHPWTVSTTCARWYPVRDPRSGPERLLARQSGIAGGSVVSRSRPRPSHVSRAPL